MIHQHISWNWENISKSGPKVKPGIMKIWNLMKRCIGSAKPHITVFRFFARYYDAKEVIHKRISWNWENISKSGPKNNVGQKQWKIEALMRKYLNIWGASVSPQNLTETVFRFFARYYDAKEVIHRISCAFEKLKLKLRKYLKIYAHHLPRNYEYLKFNEKVHRIRKTSQNRFSLYRKILRC